MQTFLISLGVFLVAVAAMAVGVILSNRRIQGSCGGLAAMKDTAGKPMCEACTDPTSCPEYVREHPEAVQAAATTQGAGSR